MILEKADIKKHSNCKRPNYLIFNPFERNQQNGALGPISHTQQNSNGITKTK